jgi:(2Fe-2S) ferredoxin
VSENDEAADPSAALRCSFAAELRGDGLLGTAAPAAGFLLIEQPGPWGRLALVDSRLDPAVGAAVGTRAVAAGLRTLLIRRPGRSSDSGDGGRRKWALALSTPGDESMRWGEFGRDNELLDLPFDGSAGTRAAEACYLVCTHGRHDACCAIRGRPVAASLERRVPGSVWECSHIGGDRFAPNLLVLPHGFYYGRVSEDAGYEVVDAHERGEVAMSWLRGRTTFSPPAQAAQHLARLRREERAINALTPRSVETLGQARWRVRLAALPVDLLVTVATVASEAAAFLTCAASHSAHPPAYRLEEMRESR